RSPVGGAYEEVLEPHALSAAKAREGSEEDGIARGVLAARGNERLGDGALAEQRAPQQLGRRVEFVLDLLVDGEVVEELEQQRHVGGLGSSDDERGRGTLVLVVMHRGRAGRDRCRRSS